MIRSFRDLVVWQKAHVAVMMVYGISKDFPADERYGLTSQIRRSVVSVCANIAEGCCKRTKDYLRYLEIADGSLQETKYYVILSTDLKYLSSDQSERLSELLEEVGRMLGGLRRGLAIK